MHCWVMNERVVDYMSPKICCAFDACICRNKILGQAVQNSAGFPDITSAFSYNLAIRFSSPAPENPNFLEVKTAGSDHAANSETGAAEM